MTRELNKRLIWQPKFEGPATSIHHPAMLGSLRGLNRFSGMELLGCRCYRFMGLQEAPGVG